MREQILLCGGEDGPAGILRTPDPAAKAREDIAFVLLSSTDGNVGSQQRFYAELAAELAAAGFSSFRFVQTSQAKPRKSSRSKQRPADTDLQTAMTALENTLSVRKFFLSGIRSGGDRCFAAALEDPRAAGLMLIDGAAYPNFRYRLQHVVVNRLKIGYWQARWAKRTLEKVSAEPVRTFPEIKAIRAGYQALVERSVLFFVCFTAGACEYYNHRRQLLGNFADLNFQDRLSLHYLPHSDPDFSFVAARKEIFVLLVNFLKEKLPPDKAPA